MVRVGRLELPASCSQTCVGTFKRHSAALFGPFLGQFLFNTLLPCLFQETLSSFGICVGLDSVYWAAAGHYLRAAAREKRNLYRGRL